MAVDENKCYGPKTKKLVLKKVRSAERMLKFALEALENLDYDEDDDDDRPKSHRDGFTERNAVAEMFERIGKILGSVNRTIDLYPIDDRADVVELMRRGLRKTDENEEILGEANGQRVP